MFLITSLSTVVTGLIFLYIWYREPRRLALGVSFLAYAFCLAVLLFYLFVIYEQFIILIGLAILLFAILLMGPLLVIGGFIYSGILLVRREGFKFHNLLSLLFSAGLIFYITVWPMVSDFTERTIFNTVYIYISFLIVFFLLIINLYLITMVLNLLHFTKPELDYLVVLGAGLDGRRVTPLLASRVNKAIELYKKNPSIKLIMTGGQGEDEFVAEASAMASYALERGVPEEAIILENQATNTEENILYSYALMTSQNPKFAVVTNAYHVFRALLIAKDASLDCSGYGSRTKWYFTLNAFIREFIGYLYFKRRMYTKLIITFTVIYVLINAAILLIL